MVKRAIEIQRKYANRPRRKLIVLGVEGKQNKTEMLYFDELAKRTKNCTFVYANSKNDPLGIVNSVIDKAKREEIEQDDLAIAMFDVDNDESKRKQIVMAENKAKESEYNIKVLTSNPCFEIWYLEHFGFTTKPFKDGKDVEKELLKHINNYEKSRCPIEVIYLKTKQAITNVEKLREFNMLNSTEKNEHYYNPSTNVDILVKEIIQ